MLITISISSAPFLIADSASATLASVVIAPNGNPTTTQVSILVSANLSFTKEAQ